MLEEEEFFNSEVEELWVCEVCGHIHRGKKLQQPVLYVKHQKSILNANFWVKLRNSYPF